MTAVQVDQALVEQATRGDGDAFTCLYETYLEPVYRHIHYRVGGREEVEDLTQEVFIRAWRSIRRYKLRQSPFLAWLYTIAHNLVIDYYRKKGQEHLVPIDELLRAVHQEHDSELESVLDLDVVRQLLARLPRDQQQALVLRFVEGLDCAEVAIALGKSQGAVRVMQLRALRRLGRLLKVGEEKSVRNEGPKGDPVPVYRRGQNRAGAYQPGA